ncbi:hypothetical protein AgCh_010532 [Apium graveolens]
MEDPALNQDHPEGGPSKHKHTPQPAKEGVSTAATPHSHPEGSGTALEGDALLIGVIIWRYKEGLSILGSRCPWIHLHQQTLKRVHILNLNVIELSQYKYTNVPVAEEYMTNLTSHELAEAIRLYRDEQARAQIEYEQDDEQEESGDSQQSRRSVFDRIGAKEKKNKKKPSRKETEATRKKKLEEMREQIRREEEAKLELKIQKMMQLEKEMLLAKTKGKRTRRDPTPEIISDDEEEGQKDLKDMIYELQRKMEKDSGMEVGETLTPFIHSLETIPRQKNLKHHNFDSFDGLGDPEEHLNYFEQIAQIYYYNNLTKSRFFASTLKGGVQRWFSRIPSRSIHSWKEFRGAFFGRFGANKTHEMHMCHLETIRQYDNESLSAYMRRNLDPEHNERYIVELINKEPQSLAVAYSMAARFIKETDVLQAMRMTRNGGSRNKTSDARPKGGYHQEKKFKQKPTSTADQCRAKHSNISKTGS